MTPSPVGIEISKGKRKWKVGKVLGQGACATVCSLITGDERSTEIDFAIKLAPLPKKKTRKGNSSEETNVKLLYYEQLIYTTQFRSLQGTFIPNVPNPSSSKDPPLYGDENGFRFFVMEKMDSTISAVVPLLLKSKSTSKTINIGPLAVKLLECVKGVHETKNIIRDVKTENFMLTRDGGVGTTLEKKIASRIRLIDLAMAMQWTTMYRETDEGEGLIGTPLYASLNCHAGKKPSFRDDLESLGYVIAEILTQLYAGDPSKQLPWCDGKSDEEIGSKKEKFVNDEKSRFYSELGSTQTARVFKDYMEIVRGCTFKKAPDYDELCKVLSNLTVPRKKVSSKRACVTKKKETSTKRTRSTTSSAADMGASPTKLPRRSTRNTAKTIINVDEEEYHSASEHDGSIEGTIYEDAQQDVQEMDWEYTDDIENTNPEEDLKPKARTRSGRNGAPPRGQRTTRSKKAAEDQVVASDVAKENNDEPTKRLKRRGVRIICTDGPHKGEVYEMEAGVNEIVVIGSKPTSKIGETLSFQKDQTIKSTHVRLDLAINRKLTTVKVTDKSKGETYVNRDAVKSTKAFINDTIYIGETSLKIQSL